MSEYKTPLRVSLFGGGTDYPAWYKDNEGLTIGGAINFFIRWEDIGENLCTHEEAEIIQKLKSYLGYSDTVLSYENNAHLFIGKGLGASSASLASLLKLVSNDGYSSEDIIRKVTEFERDFLGKDSGDQDQILTNTPGFRWVKFLKNGQWTSSIFSLSDDFRDHLNSCLFLIDTNVARSFPNITSQSIRKTSSHSVQEIHDIAKEAQAHLETNSPSLESLGLLLNKTWKAKKGINPHISNEAVDQIISLLEKEGVYGSKLLGSGGGGFILTLAPRELMKQISNKWSIPVMDIEFI